MCTVATLKPSPAPPAVVVAGGVEATGDGPWLVPASERASCAAVEAAEDAGVGATCANTWRAPPCFAAVAEGVVGVVPFAAVEAQESVGVEAAATVQLQTASAQSVPPVHAAGVLSGWRPLAVGAGGSVEVVEVVVAGLSESFVDGAGVAEAHAPVCGPSR